MNNTLLQQYNEENERLKAELVLAHKGKTNSGFVQVSKAYLDTLDGLYEQSPSAGKVLVKMVKVMNKQNALLISQQSLCKLCGISLPTVKRAITVLRQQNWVEVIKVGQANVYRVNSNVFWQARADGKWASFSAEVLVDWDEQDSKTKAGTKLNQTLIPDANEEVMVTDAGNPPNPQLDFHQSELVSHDSTIRNELEAKGQMRLTESYETTYLDVEALKKYAYGSADE